MGAGDKGIVKYSSIVMRRVRGYDSNGQTKETGRSFGTVGR
jgi:hypothetical protein